MNHTSNYNASVLTAKSLFYSVTATLVKTDGNFFFKKSPDEINVHYVYKKASLRKLIPILGVDVPFFFIVHFQS